MKELRRTIIRKLSRPLAVLIFLLLHLLRLTMRIETVGGDIFRGFTSRAEAVIGIFWHGRLLMVPFAYPGKSLHVLIGRHRDGQLIADVMTCFGFGLVRGSSSKGGVAALRESLRLLNAGNDLAITPDGPNGPAEVAKLGVAQAAMVSGRAVLPVAFSASRSWRIKSWDRLLIPKPFSRGVYVIGQPVRYQKGEALEAFRERIEAALRETTNRADDMALKRAA